MILVCDRLPGIVIDWNLPGYQDISLLHLVTFFDHGNPFSGHDVRYDALLVRNNVRSVLPGFLFFFLLRLIDHRQGILVFFYLDDQAGAFYGRGYPYDVIIFLADILYNTGAIHIRLWHPILYIF